MYVYKYIYIYIMYSPISHAAQITSLAVRKASISSSWPSMISQWPLLKRLDHWETDEKMMVHSGL